MKEKSILEERFYLILNPECPGITPHFCFDWQSVYLITDFFKLNVEMPCKVKNQMLRI